MAPRSKSALKLQHRPSGERGHLTGANGGITSALTFSFHTYRDNRFNGLGSLKAVNEDRIRSGKGFGEHQHGDSMQIWTYMIKGELEHVDSMGNVETIKAGDIQMTSAGSGISHRKAGSARRRSRRWLISSPGSEFNRHPSKPCHFLQLWALPSHQQLEPSYYTRNFPAAAKKNKLVKVVAPIDSAEVSDERGGDGPVPIHAALTMHASLLASGSLLSDSLGSKVKTAYLHLVQSSGYRGPTTPPDGKGAQIRINDDLVLEEGDSALIEVGKSGSRELKAESTGKREAEWILVEME